MNNQSSLQNKSTLDGYWQLPWQHPAYLALWNRLPYGLQIRLIELEARLERKFANRLHGKQRRLSGLQLTAGIAVIGVVVQGLTHVLFNKR